MYLQRFRVAENLELHPILTSSLSVVPNGFPVGMAGCRFSGTC